MMERRLVRREDTVARNRVEEKLTTEKEIITPDAWTPIIAISITPQQQDSIFFLASASLVMKGVKGYGKVRLTWTQGGLTHIVEESEGRVNPLGGEEYMREVVVEGLTLGDSVGITLEGSPVGETLCAMSAHLYAEEW